MEQSVNTVWIPCYSSDGFKLSFTVSINSVDDAMALLDAIRNAGLTPREPSMVEGQEKEIIAAVVRRQSSDGTPIIDFYPAWSHAGKFGAHKYAHLYLNTKEDITEFEAQSGLRLNDIPLYESQTPMQRKFGTQPHRCEIAVKRTFEVVRTPDGQHDTGMPKYKYSYYAPVAKQNGANGNGHHADTPQSGSWVNQDNLATAFNAVKVRTGDSGMKSLEFANYAGVSHPQAYDEWREQHNSMEHAIETAVATWEAKQKAGGNAKPKGSAGNGSATFRQ
jgi:hypothetical protein